MDAKYDSFSHGPKPGRTSAFLSVLLLLSSTAAIHASTRNAASPSYADVNTAVTAAANGDTVMIPAGTATWNGSSTIEFTKNITIQGAGIGHTIIKQYSSSNLMFHTHPGSSGLQRFTGISFENMSSNGLTPGSQPIIQTDFVQQVRIDHCSFLGGKRTVYIRTSGTSLIDHCTFLNNDSSVAYAGADDTTWNLYPATISAGTSHSNFIEDCTFTLNSPNIAPSMIEHDSIGSYGVLRHCIFEVTRAVSDWAYVEAHGNQGYYHDSGSSRGVVLLEIYNNTFHSAKRNYVLTPFRGGSILMHDNVFSVDDGTCGVIRFTEEEGWATPALGYPWFTHNITTWPAQDQIFNSFIWNNTWQNTGGVANGTLISPFLNNPNDSIFIQQNRDWFAHAPQNSGGSESFPVHPGLNMTFTSSGPNAYYPYAAYTYPHPLAGGSPTPTPTPSPTSTPTPTATPVGTSFNSTQGEIVSPFVVNTDNSVSQSVETDDPTQGGKATYTFTIADAGDYTMFAIVSCPDSGSNSFFVDTDGDPVSTMVWQIPVTSGFESRMLTWSGLTTPRFWALSAGVHQLVIRGREADTKIKSITLVKQPAAPSDPHVAQGN